MERKRLKMREEREGKGEGEEERERSSPEVIGRMKVEMRGQEVTVEKWRSGYWAPGTRAGHRSVWLSLSRGTIRKPQSSPP